MFSRTKVIKNNRNSSIIIKFDESRGVSEFQLPVGFEGFPDDSYELKKELFFRTYHSYRKFIEEKKALIERRKSKPNNKPIIEQDTVSETNDTFHFKDGISGAVITYQKLVMFDSVLDAYDELRIQSLQDKISKTEQIDYARIDKYMHRAVYLPGDVIYIDEMDLPKKIIKDASTELVEMFCYIYSEILNEFGTVPENNKVITLANNFKEKRLYEESSLFSEDTYEDTIEVLKEVLDEIEQTTPYKDFDYWHFYDAVHNFIYSNNDGQWRLDNFSFIWERMCMAFAFKFYPRQISLFDNFGLLEEPNLLPSIKEHFKVSFRPTDTTVRFIRPDLVLKDTAFIIADDFLEKIYTIKKKPGEVDVSYNRLVDYSNYTEIDALKKNLFKDKPRIQSFYNSANRFPPTFTITNDEYETFKIKAKEVLQKKGYFELSVRTPKIVTEHYSVEELNKYLVVDFKYMSESAFSEQLDFHINNTVRKQYVYELALKLNRNASTSSEFWIPSFLQGRRIDNLKTIRKYSKNCDPFFQKYRISVIQLDFLALQEIYIQNAI